MTELVPPLAEGEPPIGGGVRKSDKPRIDPAAAAQIEQMFGSVALLMTRSKAHRNLTVSDLETLVLPALVLRQARIMKTEEGIVAYASWAFLSADAEARLNGQSLRLAPTDWRSGDQAWIIDLIAPPKLAKKLLEVIRSGPLGGRSVKMRKQTEARDVLVLEPLPPKLAEHSM